jgi:hypothetical protein
MENSFIDHFDPTKDISRDLDSISLIEQYNNLTEDDKILIFCKINGYNRIPPTIERLYSDSYYLGGQEFFDGGNMIYDFWKDNLKNIFPTCVNTSKPFLILSGAIGIGKSTVSKICLAMTYARLLCMKNPSRTLGLAPKPFSAVIYHRDEKVAYKEFRNWFVYDVLEKSPFFKTIKPNFKFQVLTSGPMSQAGLGSDVLVYILSEVNFYPNPVRARGIIETCYGRFTSRFDNNAIRKVGNFIIDSSAKGDSSCTEWFLDNCPKDLMWNCKPTHFDVKPQAYSESHGKTFDVYTGDGKYPAQILAEDYRLAEDQDPDRVIHVPIQLKIEAKQNLEKMLQDKCGISTSSSDSFFNGSVQHLSNCFKHKNIIPEVVTVDFYDKSDRLIDKVSPATKDIPFGSSIWLGLDLATSDDYTGISCVQFDGWINDNGVKSPKVKVYFCLGVSRKEGQETSLFHIFDLIVTLSKRFNVIVSADQAFSKQILQDCEREGIKTNGRISTDLVPNQPALYLKNLILQESITIPENKRLLREAYDLRYVPTSKGYKIDHPKKATQNPGLFDVNNGIGSKDLWDSLASAVYSLKMSIDAGEEGGYSNGVDKQLELVTRMTENSRENTTKQFQSMLEDIF